MKKGMIALSISLLAFLHVYPLGWLLSYYCGYNFAWQNASVVAVIIMMGFVATVVGDIWLSDRIHSVLSAVMWTLTLPLVLINGLLQADHGLFVILCYAVSAGCSLYLTIRRGRPLALKIISLVESGGWTVLIALATMIVLVFGGLMGEETVVKTLPSPEGTYYAEVVDSDQGAMGGATYVQVYHPPVFSCFLFKVEDPPTVVYTGKWGEYKHMDIRWKSEDCLLIDGQEYPIVPRETCEAF